MSPDMVPGATFPASPPTTTTRSRSSAGRSGRRIIGPGDIATLAVHLMTNTAVTGAIFDIDGGQQLVES
jgi:hypothetical protein